MGGPAYAGLAGAAVATPPAPKKPAKNCSPTSAAPRSTLVRSSAVKPTAGAAFPPLASAVAVSPVAVVFAGWFPGWIFIGPLQVGTRFGGIWVSLLAQALGGYRILRK